MKKIQAKKAGDFRGDLAAFLKEYTHLPQLTNKLDNLSGTPFTEHLVNEIVLWKVNRYVSLDPGTLAAIDRLKRLKNGEHRRAEPLLQSLLEARGIDLAMASTICRFRNPVVFQIIDRHAYRAVYGHEYSLNTKCAAGLKIDLYFTYLDDLISLCTSKGLQFEISDRALYMFDKRKNGKL